MDIKFLTSTVVTFSRENDNNTFDYLFNIILMNLISTNAIIAHLLHNPKKLIVFYYIITLNNYLVITKQKCFGFYKYS